MDTFFLGTPEPSWLKSAPVPLFVSRRRLMKCKRLPRAATTWALDSGGYTELTMFGTWRTTVAEYVADMRRYTEEIGRMAWAAPMDWMVEPWLLAKTGLSVEEHQQRTVDNYVELHSRAPELPIIPVLQGWEPVAYLAHVEMYERAGIDLSAEPLVGIGSVCRRQRMTEGVQIVRQLAAIGLRLHGFGVKITGLRDAAHHLVSADSMAWSHQARKGNLKMPDCQHRGARCTWCQRWALQWRERVLASIARPKQEVFAWA